MKNLSKNLKLALDKINFIYEKGMDYKNINKCYKKINNIFIITNCEVYDINDMLSNYKVKNKYTKTIYNLKKLVKSRNRNIFKLAYKNGWKKFIQDLRKELNEIFVGKLDNKHVEEGVSHVMKKYNNNWIGYWTIINVNSKGYIKNINLFDMNDYNELKHFLHKKKKYLYKK